MSVDLDMIPAAGFLEWAEDQWDEFFSSEPAPECVELGKHGYVGQVTEVISHNLETGKPGSRFPLFMRFELAEVIGWTAQEIDPLLAEIHAITRDLKALPINGETMNRDESEVDSMIAGFKKHYPQRPLQSIYDLYYRFFDEFHGLAEKAHATGHGLFVSC